MSNAARVTSQSIHQVALSLARRYGIMDAPKTPFIYRRFIETDFGKWSVDTGGQHGFRIVCWEDEPEISPMVILVRLTQLDDIGRVSINEYDTGNQYVYRLLTNELESSSIGSENEERSS